MDGDFAAKVMKATVDSITDQMRKRLSSIRLPETGEFPTVVVGGDTLETLSFRVEGSPALLALVQERLGSEYIGYAVTLFSKEKLAMPNAFLSYAWEDRELAGSIAHGLQAGGIETWWAEWEMRAGDSLRQKIDEGLSGCTHFIVLLTPTSLGKPWVKQEMDAGLVRKLGESAVTFIPLRHQLAPSALPPLLSGMLSPEIVDVAVDLPGIIKDIHGLSRKPPVGIPPKATQIPHTGYSHAASAVAKLFVERSATAVFADPQIQIGAIVDATGLTRDDVVDAIYELGNLVQVHREHILVKDEMFVTFDKHFTGNDPSSDGLRLAADLVNSGEFPGQPSLIAEKYGWGPRRLNPAIAYLTNRKLVRSSEALGTQPWITAWISRTDETRRFVKSRM